MNGDRVRKTQKSNTTAVFLEYFENENWDHCIECCNNKHNIEEWGKDPIKKIEKMEQCKKEDEEEKLHANEILKDTSKHLNNEYYHHTNQ